MRFLTATLVMAAAFSVGPPSADGQEPSFVTLTTGGLLLVNGQRVVVAREPGPTVVIAEAPPAPLVPLSDLPAPPFAGAIWVRGHWTQGADGFTWVDGSFITPKPGHVFVPPRWTFFGGRHLFFAGFFVPHGVWVRSFFNTFHFSGDPTQRASLATRVHGPYWPIGLRGRTVATPRGKGRGPYWPLGLGPPTVLNTRGGTIVGLPSHNTRR
jgi:hypothetical protein